MTTLQIKPMSVNEAWQGKRFKTNAYKNYEKNLYFLLPKHYPIPEGLLALTMWFGFSSIASDADNPVKPFQDILQKKYKFNDKRIFELHIYKALTMKGREFIMFDISAAQPKTIPK